MVSNYHPICSIVTTLPSSGVSELNQSPAEFIPLVCKTLACLVLICFPHKKLHFSILAESFVPLVVIVQEICFSFLSFNVLV